MRYNDLKQFLQLSAVLNYHLSAAQINWDGVADIILEGKIIAARERQILTRALAYLREAYGERRRKLGPFSVLHPLRTAVLLAQSSNQPRLLDLLTALLHDSYEELGGIETQLAQDPGFQELVNRVPEGTDKWYLGERIPWLTRSPEESYCCYVDRLLSQARATPEVVLIKLADRLDNTLDMHINLVDPLDEVDFFEKVFQVLFTRSQEIYTPATTHPPSGTMNGAKRLYQLYKNIVLMSLIRQKRSDAGDPAAREIFLSLADASMREAQRIVLHIAGHHKSEPGALHEMIISTMAYVQEGGIDTITAPGEKSLDGLVLSQFDHESSDLRNEKLDAVYQDKPLMVEAAFSFVAVFMSFLTDADYYIHGISAAALEAQTTDLG